MRIKPYHLEVPHRVLAGNSPRIGKRLYQTIQARTCIELASQHRNQASPLYDILIKRHRNDRIMVDAGQDLAAANVDDQLLVGECRQVDDVALKRPK